MQFELCRTISADHPSLPGHFPDTPVVPAVVILDEVIAALAEWRGDCQLTAIPTVKFLAPLKPNQPFTICLSARDVTAEQFDFSCQIGNRTIVQGRLQVRPNTNEL
jgi:3-hydroxymyristoyl/3-hydroxydecanoyl-(acyl carrier protein) dehydratase